LHPVAYKKGISKITIKYLNSIITKLIIMHDEIIKKLASFSRNLMCIPIKEFSLNNIDLNSDGRIDLVLIDKNVNPVYAFEVDKVSENHFDKNTVPHKSSIIKLSDNKPNCRIYYILYDNRKRTRLGYVFDPSPNTKFLKFLKEEIECL
jgi:hypothetical protein